MSLTINGVSIAVQGVRALKPGITIEQAALKTKNNGLDEVFFTSNGKAYVAYGDSLNISALKKNNIPTVAFDSQKADIVAYDDEANSMMEGAKLGALKAIKDSSDAVFGAVKNIITTIGPTAGVAGGVGLAGYSIYQMVKASGQGAAVGAVGASLAAAPGMPPGFAGGILDALKSGVVGGLKLIAIAGGVGAGITMTYGAIKGAMEAKSINKDLSTIASITEDGSRPTNGGAALTNFNPGNGYSTQPNLPGNNGPAFGQPIGINIQITPQGGFSSVSSMMSPQQMMSMQRR